MEGNEKNDPSDEDLLKPPTRKRLVSASSSQDSLDRRRSSSFSLLDHTSHQLTLERMLNPSVLFESIRDARQGKAKSPAHGGTDKKLRPPLMTLQQAARDGRIDIVQQHIEAIGKDKKKLNKKDHDQTTALHYAVRYGHFGIVQLLVDNGASVNVEGEYGATPLHYAARYVFKTLRKGYTTPLLSPQSLNGRKNKEKDNIRGLRSLMISNAQKRKTSVSKHERRPSFFSKKATVSIPKGLRNFVESVSRSNRSLINVDTIHLKGLETGNTIHQSLVTGLNSAEREPLLRESVPASPSQVPRNSLSNSLRPQSEMHDARVARTEQESSSVCKAKSSLQDIFTPVRDPSMVQIKTENTTLDSPIAEDSINNDEHGYMLDNPTVLVVGTLSQEELSGLNALIIPQIREVGDSVENVGLKRDRKTTVSLPDISAALNQVSATDGRAGSQCSVVAEPVPVNVVNKNRFSLKYGSRPRLVGKKFYVGKSLSDAVKPSDDDCILKYLLLKRANPNTKDYYGCTPLHYAAMRGNVLAARQLLEQQNFFAVNIEAKDRTKMTPLHCAASNGSLEICDLLLQHNASLRCLDEEDMTPLHFAAMEGQLDIVLLFFRVGENRGGWSELAKMIMDQDRDEQTALHLAVENGHIDIVRACLDRGANVNFVKANLITPLHLACTSGQLDIVEVLVNHDADIEAKNALQETPLHRAALFNRVKIVQFLLNKGAYIDCPDKDKETPLMMAVRKNNVETVKLLLSEGAKVTVKDAEDKTCLYVAAEEDCVETFKLLAQHPKVSKLLEDFDKNENTPLHVAAMKGFIKIVRMLLDMGACIDAKNDQNLTPLHLASKHGRSRIVKILLMRDLSIVNDEDDSSNTPLHLAALEGHVKVVQILLECGAAVDARNATLWTPLDCAASRGWTWCAEALLDGDSLIDPQDKAKTTPLHLASKEGHVDMINLLLSRKAEITRKDHMGRNCLDWAIENNQREAAMAIVGSKNWEAAMRNCTVEGSKITTPMRKLIKKLPEVAEKVFNQCITGNGLPMEHPLYEISCNYEFLEDSFTEWGPSLYDCRDLQVHYQNYVVLHRGISSPSKSQQPALWQKLMRKLSIPGYVKQQSEIKQNHPLKFMVRSERTKLLCHPLVTYLLRHKWKACGRYVYYSKLLLYIIFLMFLTGYALTISTDKYAMKCVDSESIRPNAPPAPPAPPLVNNSSNCEMKCVLDMNIPATLGRQVFVDFGRYVVLILAVISFLLEIPKLMKELCNYFRPHRLIESGCYILSTLYILEAFAWRKDGETIEIVQNARCTFWHRSLGAITIWLSWISLVMFMRKFPKLGIYVVMFTDIMKTFAQFFLVFVLFIIAFGLGFHMLLYEQTPIAFLTPARAMLKTTMGMLGEFEYDTVFNDQSQTPVAAAWFIYMAYLIINCIILMNLLVGLAVDDIKGVQEQAALKRLAMQVDLTLDVEKALPLSWQRRLITMEESIRPNAGKGWNFWSFWSFKSAVSLSSIGRQASPMERLQKQQGELKETVRGLRNKMKYMEAQNARMEAMLAALIKHHSITVEYEVDKEDQR